ncbi:MAG: response regulator transcription factor [Bryobacteraceae bacterium]
MLPVLDGFEVARRLRSTRPQVPILMLTGRDGNADVIRGLDAGADDYLTKPFSFEVLLARLRALTRRSAEGPPVRLQVSDLVMDLSTHEVHRGRVAVGLTRTEYSILECLMRRAGRVVPRNDLIGDVWSVDREIENNTLDVFIRLLRAKIEAGGAKRLIHTVRGVGYTLRVEEPS